MKFVVYLRVSTDKQGKSGLGLEAQQSSVAEYAKASAGQVVAEYVEVESGKNASRPELAAALHEAKKQGATLLIAKLDRLARNVAFISSLLESGVDIVAVDMPSANKFMLHVMAAVAEQEAALISERTKAALAARKARGGLQGLALPQRRHEVAQVVAKATKARISQADRHAANVLPIIDTIKATGASLRDVANALNERGIKTVRGGTWYATTVANVLDRRERICPT